MVWSVKGNIKGPKGDQGLKGDQGIKGDQGVKGDTGNTGVRGSLWFIGIGAPTASNTVGAQSQDMYIDTSTGDIYQF